jgi:hypothetical protein
VVGPERDLRQPDGAREMVGSISVEGTLDAHGAQDRIGPEGTDTGHKAKGSGSNVLTTG